MLDPLQIFNDLIQSPFLMNKSIYDNWISKKCKTMKRQETRSQHKKSLSNMMRGPFSLIGLTIFPPFQSVAEFKNLNCKCCSTHSTLAPLSTFGRIQLQAILLWSEPVIIGSVNFNLQIQWAIILQISEPCMNAYLCRPHTFCDL